MTTRPWKELSPDSSNASCENLLVRGELVLTNPSGVGGAGAVNKVPKWTPNGMTLGDSRITDDGVTVTVAGSMEQTSVASGVSGAKFTKTTVGSATSYAPALHGVNSGSYDTTAGELNAIAVFGECNASRSAGASPLFCSGVYGYDNGGSNATDRYGVRGVQAASAGVNLYAGGFTNLSIVNTYKWAVAGTSQGDNGTKYGGYFGASGLGINWALYTTEGDVALNVNNGSAYAYGPLVISSAEKIASVISPVALGAGDNPDYGPAGLATCRIVRLTSGGALTTLSGLVAVNNQVVTLVNIAADTITVLAQSALSAPAFRFAGGAVLAAAGAAGSAATYWYDGVTGRWRQI